SIEESWAYVSGGPSVRLKYIPLKPKMESVVMPPVPYSPQSIDRLNASFKSPAGNQQIRSSHERHWLGTDGLGRDVLAGLIHGSRLALMIGFLSVFLAMLTGVLLGAAAGFYGDRGIRIHRITLFFAIIGLLGLVYGLYLAIDGGVSSPTVFTTLLFFIGLTLVYLGVRKSSKIYFNGTTAGAGIYLPLDLIILRVVEIFRSIPALFILLALIALLDRPGVMQISLILALLMWPSFARYTRAEFLSLREKEFVSAGRLLRKTDGQLIFSEILPNARAPLVVLAAFGVSAAILAEATLSFLGLGLAIDQVSWGSMLNEARKYFRAWWLAVFPGLALFFVIYSMNALGDYFEVKKTI
nr:ABC transporter permease [Saprospiraceae bacterium]